MTELNSLYFGDNQTVLRSFLESETVDLIYLDPPFNSKRHYAITRNKSADASEVERYAFNDKWKWDDDQYRRFMAECSNGPLQNLIQGFLQCFGPVDLMAYVVMMAARITELHRVLKSSGSLYLHCDPGSSHYLKLVLDCVFGSENFRNELIWNYGGRGAKAVARQYPRNHDIILYYSRSKGHHQFARPDEVRRLTPDQARARGIRQDGEGQWFKTAPCGDYSDESVRHLMGQGRIHVTLTGSVRVKYPLEESEGFIVERIPMGDVWSDIPDGMHMRRSGYPTEKPLLLLERIIAASTQPGDMVLDPFCGSGTALVAAQSLERRWIGIDSGPTAISASQSRLGELFEDKKWRTETLSIPTDGLPTVSSEAGRAGTINRYWIA